LLWNSLALIAGAKIDIYKAEYAYGEWHRRPKPACWDGKDQGSKSTTSNDMLSGLLYALWHAKDGPGALRLYKYGKQHLWFMGKPKSQFARVILRPNGQSLLANILCKTIEYDLPERHFPDLYFPVKNDYEHHLMTIGILLHYEIHGDITKQMLKRLKENVDKYPDDALFNAALGLFDQEYMGAAVDLIIGSYNYPSYVRGHESYRYIHLLFAIYVIELGMDNVQK
jgi:hypothetical protein